MVRSFDFEQVNISWSTLEVIPSHAVFGRDMKHILDFQANLNPKVGESKESQICNRFEAQMLLETPCMYLTLARNSIRF
jgi:hypothetical protein